MVSAEQLNLRGLAVWERAPLVLERFDTLDVGGSLHIVTDSDPRALMSRLEQLRPGQFAFTRRHVGNAHWTATLTRVPGEAGVSGVSVAVERSAIFSRASERTRAKLVDAMSEHTARKGEVLSGEDSTPTALGIVLDGALAVFAGAGSREQVLFRLFPLDVFGQVEFFDQGATLGRTAVLSKTARYALLPYATLETLLERDPELARSMAADVAQQCRSLASALTARASQSILARIAGALLPYAAPERGLHPALLPLPSMTQAQVAAAAGTVKEVAARAIAELERMHALRREHGHIRYLDRVKLLEIVSS